MPVTDQQIPAQETPALTPRDQVDFYVRPNMKQANPYLDTLFWDYKTNTPTLHANTYTPKGLQDGVDHTAPAMSSMSRKSYFEDLNRRALEASRKQDPLFGTPLSHTNVPEEETKKYTGHNKNAGYYYQRGTDNEERSAQNQTLAGVLGTGLLSFAEKTSSVTLSSIGYLMNLPSAIIGGNASDAADNWLSNWANEAYENRRNQVFYSHDYQNKSVVGQLFTPTWWATTGADMAGFIAGNIIPAAAVSKISLLPKLAKGLSSAVWGAKAGRLAEGAGVLAESAELFNPLKSLVKSRKFLQSMGFTETALTSSISEATFEASDTKQRIYENLIKQGVNPIEAERKAKESADRTFWWNTALLLPSSMWEIKAILGTKAGLAETMRFLKNGELVAPILKDKLKSAAKEAAIGALAEGVWEENVQQSIQNLGDKISSGKIDSSIASQLKSLLEDTTVTNFTTREGQENILGGVVMGILAGGAKGYREKGSAFKKAEVAYERYKSGTTSVKDLAHQLNILSDHVKGDDFVLKLPDGSPILSRNQGVLSNVPSVINKIKEIGNQVDFSRFMASAAEANDSDLFTHSKNLLTASFVYNHMVNGLEDMLDSKVEALRKASPKDREELGALFDDIDENGNKISYDAQLNHLTSKIEEYKKIFNKVYDFYGRGQEIWDKNLGNYFVNPVGSIFLEAVNNQSLKERIDDLSARKQEVESSISQKASTVGTYLATKEDLENLEIKTPEQIANAYARDNKTDLDVQTLSSLKKKTPSYIQQLKDSNERYKALTDPKLGPIFKDLLANLSKKIENKEPAEEVTEEPTKEPAKATPETIIDDSGVSDDDLNNVSPKKPAVKSQQAQPNTEVDTDGVVAPPGQSSVADIIRNAKNPKGTQGQAAVSEPAASTPEDKPTIDRYKGVTNMSFNPRNLLGQLFSKRAVKNPESKPFTPVTQLNSRRVSRRNSNVRSNLTTNYMANLLQVAYNTVDPEGLRTRILTEGADSVIEILTSDNKPIGILANPNSFFYVNKDGNEVPLDWKISEEDYIAATGDAQKNEYEAFKHLTYVYAKLYEAIKNNPDRPLNELATVVVQNNEMAVSSKPEFRTTFSNINPDVNGILDSKGQRHPVIVSVPALYDESLNSYVKYDTVRIIRSSKDAQIQDTALDEKIEKVVNEKLSLIQRVGTRYVGIVELPGKDGPTYQVVALSPSQATSGEISELFNSIKQRSLDTAAANVEAAEVEGKNVVVEKDKSFNDDFNNNLLNSFYIANNISLSRLYNIKDGEINNLAKNDMTLTVSPKGNVRFVVVNRPLGGGKEDLVRMAVITPQEMANINNMSQLVDHINNELKKEATDDPGLQLVLNNTNFSVESFKKNIRDDEGGTIATTEEIGNKLVSPFTKDLINPFVYVYPKDNTVNASPSVVAKQEIVKPTVVPQQKESPAKNTMPAEETSKDSEQLSAEQPGVVKPKSKAERLAEAEENEKKLKEQNKQNNQTRLDDLDSGDLDDSGIVFKTSPVWSKDDFDIRRAQEWLKAYLPVESGKLGSQQINPLIHKVLVDGKKVWGYVESGVVYLSTNAGKGTEYHEAFHAVFRYLLDDRQIDSYLKFGRKELGNPKATDLEVEEYLADKFMNWRLGKEKAGIWGRLWNFLKEAVEAIFTHRRRLNALFHSIDRGDYRLSSIASNRFTLKDKYNPEPVYKLVKLPPEKLNDEKGTIVPRYLSPEQSREIVQNVVSYAQTYREKGQAEGLSDSKLIDKVIQDLQDLYDSDKTSYDNVDEDALFNKFYIYHNTENRESIKEGAVELMATFKNLVDEYAQSILDEESDAGVTTAFDDNKENHGGFNSLPKELRAYIGLTSYDVEDEFGNKTLQNGVPLRRTVDGVRIYYSVLRGLANITNEDLFLQKLEAYSRDNEQTSRFFQKLLNDIDLSLEDLKAGKLDNIQNPVFAQKVIKAFNKARVDYLHLDYNTDSKSSRSYKANRKNVEHTQFNLWNNNYTRDFVIREDTEGLKSVHENIVSLINRVISKTYRLSDEDMADHVSQVQNTLSQLGIDVSKGFVKYSLLSPRVKAFNKAREDNPLLDFEDSANAFISEDDYNWYSIMEIPEEQTLTPAFFGVLRDTLKKGGSPFKEMDTRLLDAARGNAMFDETVGDSSFTNAENKTIYSHQDWTYNLRMIHDLRNPEYRENMRNGVRGTLEEGINAYDKEWLSDNILLNLEGPNKELAENFEAIANKLEHNREGGMRASDNSSALTYGDYSPREFAFSLLSNYVSYAKQIKIGKSKSILTAPHLIRVLSDKKTADLVSLPVIQGLYDAGKLSDKAISILSSEINREFNRIKRVKDQIDSNISKNVIWNYHNGKKRGLQISDSLSFLLNPDNSELKNKVEQAALEGKDYSEVENDVKSSIASQFENMLDGTISLLETSGLVETRQGSLYNVLLPGVYTNGDENLGLDKDLRTNIGKVLANDFINTLAYNQILHGDPALSFKNDGGIDPVKRAGGDNAALTSIYSNLTAPSLGITDKFTHSNVAIIEEPKGLLSIKDKDGNPVSHDIADAQMWTTVRGLRYTLWGLGRLSPKLASVLDKMEAGEEVSAKEIFDKSDGLIARHEMTNSLKLTYKDGHRYLKMSVVVLQPSLTSYKDKDGNWKAYPNMQVLHDLRTNMEDKDIHFVVPVSASKMLSADVLASTNGVFKFQDLKPHKFDNRYFGLQTENPSNKLEVTLGTQLIQLIDTEQNFKDKDGNDVMVYHNGQFITLENLTKKYQEYISRRFVNNYTSASNSIFYTPSQLVDDVKGAKKTGNVSPRLLQFQNMALKNLQKTGADPQLLEFFSLENGRPKYNLNMPVTIDKYVQLYLSYFNRGVFSQRVPGYTAALMSSYGIKTIRQVQAVGENGKPVRSRVVKRSEWLRNRPEVAGKTEGLAVGDHYLDNLKYNEPEYDSKGNITGYYSEVMLPAHFKELLKLNPGDPIPDAVARMFGIRIPSQDKHSFATLKLVDYLPTNMGSTIIVPPEILWISGADFDIDKMFIQRPDFYVKGGKMLKYGTAQNWEDRWDEYKRYQMANNKFLWSKLKDNRDFLRAWKDYEETGVSMDGLVEDNDDGVSKDDFIDFLLSSEKDVALSGALKDLGLPYNIRTFKEESAKGELNNGVLNNLMLEAISALQTNDSVRELAETPATQDLLKAIANDESHKVDGKPLYNYGEKYPVDSLPGKMLAHKNNTTGKRNIGIDVNYYMAATILQKYGVKIDNPKYHFRFDGHTFDTYAGTRQYNPQSDLKKESPELFTGDRTFAVTDNLTSAATDEAKDQQNALYNLSVPALKVVNALVLQHVPLTTAIDLVNQPVVQEYIKDIEATSPRQAIKSQAEKDLLYKSRDKRNKEIEEKVMANIVSKFNIPEGIAKKINDPKYVSYKSMESDNLIEGLKRNRTGQSSLSDEDFYDLQKQSLDYFRRAYDLSDYIGKIGSVLTLSSAKSGVSKDFEGTFTNRDEKLRSLGISGSLPEDAPFDVSKVLMEKHHLSSAYLDKYFDLKNNTEKLFLERSQTFKYIAGRVENELAPGALRYKDNYKDFKRDLTAYFNIAAFKSLQDWMGKTSPTLTNDLLFDGPGHKTIIDYHREAMSKAPDNAFVRFIDALSSEDKLSKKDNAYYYYSNYINTLSGQTRGNIEGSLVTNLIDSFNALDRNPETSHLAQAYFDYLVVKDGLMFKNNSYIKFMPNYMFGMMSDAMDMATSLMQAESIEDYKDFSNKYAKLAVQTNEGSKPFFSPEEVMQLRKAFNEEHTGQVKDILYNKVFGASQFKLSRDFLDLYVNDSNHVDKIKRLKPNRAVGGQPGEKVMVINPLKSGQKVDDRRIADLKELGIHYGDKGLVSGVPTYFKTQVYSQMNNYTYFYRLVETTNDGQTFRYEMFSPLGDDATSRTPFKINLHPVANLGPRPELKDLKESYLRAHPRGFEGIESLIPDGLEDIPDDADVNFGDVIDNFDFDSIDIPDEYNMSGVSFGESEASQEPEPPAGDTITYTPKGKARQTYTVKGSKIFNKEGKEVFKEDSADRNKIFANLAVQQGRAVVVTTTGTNNKNNTYVVNNKDQIISGTTGKIMNWGPENGVRKTVLSLAHRKFESLKPDPSTLVKNSKGKYNIWAGTKENELLSNMALRPFIYNGGEFSSVEQAYQEAKLQFTKGTPSDIAVYNKIANSESSFEAKSLGRKYTTLDTKEWDKNSGKLMKLFIKASFEQNEKAKELLLSTGNSILTHTQDKGRWGKEFPRILMEVRSELRGQPQVAQGILNFEQIPDLDNTPTSIPENPEDYIDTSKGQLPPDVIENLHKALSKKGPCK